MYLNGRNIFCSVLLFVASCTPEQIDLEDFNFSGTKNKNIQIVVDGGIFSLKGKQYVKITQPGIWPDENNYPINEAQVFVDDGENIFNYINVDTTNIIEINTGLYESIDSFAGEVGKTYQLNILYNGKTYTASDKMIELDVSDIEIPIEGIIHENDLYGIKIYQHNFGYNIPFKFTWLRKEDSIYTNNYSYSLDTYDLFNLINREDVTCHIGNPANGIFNSEVYLNSLWARSDDKIRVYFMSVSPKYYEFLLDYYEETDWSIGLFSSIPGNIRTNLSEGGCGYFYTSDINTKNYNMEDLISTK